MKKMKTMPDGKKVCPDEIMVNCDLLPDEKRCGVFSLTQKSEFHNA